MRKRSCDTTERDAAFHDLLGAACKSGEVEAQFGSYADEDKRMVGENAETRRHTRANLAEYALAFATAELMTEFVDELEDRESVLRAGLREAIEHLKNASDPLRQLSALEDGDS